MTQRSPFQIQILEKLGAPLLKAVSEVAARQEANGTGGEQKHEAERVAELLSKTVQISIGLAGSMEIRDADGDSMRLALAAMAGPLIANHYRTTGRVPGDGDIKRIIKALEAVLTFSDNFAAAADTTMRLENLAPGALPADEGQINIQYVTALVPVVNTVASFPFGRTENKLAQEVADRLVHRAGFIGRSLLDGTASEQERKRAELQILKALADIYVECHLAEMKRLLEMDDAARARAAEKTGGVLSMAPVWDAFDRRAGMIEVLGKSTGPEGVGAGESKAPAFTPPPQTAQPEQQLPDEQPSVQPSQQAPFFQRPPEQQQPPQVQATPPTQAESPLAMFAAKPAAQEPVQQEQPWLPPVPPAQPEPPPAQEPVWEQQPEGQQLAYAQGVDNEEASGSYSPMSFFKPKDGNGAGGEQEDR